MGIFLCLLDLSVHLICTCHSLTGCSFQLFVFSQYFFWFQIRSYFSSLKQDICVFKRKEENKQIQKLVFHHSFPTFPGGTGYWRVLFGIEQLEVLSSASGTLPSSLFLSLCLRFSSTCQQHLLKLQQTQGRSALPWLFFIKVGNLHVVRQLYELCLFSLNFYPSVPSIKLNLCLK